MYPDAFLTRLAELLEERAETHGRLVAAEMGNPLADPILDIKKSAWDGEIESGRVFINGFTRTDPRAPFGGFKASGYGRELGTPGSRELTNSKVIWQAA